MTKNKGFTLIELMVVILIVAILAAVLAPLLTGRIREAKWTEGKAGAGTIATALRAYLAEQGGNAADPTAAITTAPTDLAVIGIEAADLNGKYFSATDYTITGVSYTPSTGAMQFTVEVTAPGSIGGTGKKLTVDSGGTAGSRSVWAEL